MSRRKSLRWVREGDCFRCVSHSLAHGYPRLQINGKLRYISRWILVRRFGAVRLSVVTRHTCDHRWCIRPDHIIAGSQNDNVQDMVSRGRHVGSSKLSNVQVVEVQRLAIEGALTQVAIGAIFGITAGQVSHIKNNNRRGVVRCR